VTAAAAPLRGAAAALCDEVRSHAVVVPVGSRTHWEVGGPPPGPEAVEVRAPAGIVRFDPAELTVTVGAGTTVADLAGALAEAGQEVVLDPRDPAATVGGLLATGLSGPRRLRHGPLRDQVLELRAVTGDGRLVTAGGPTVKNVSGYDLPRLLVGSLGTLAVLVQATLRCRPLPRAAAWYATGAPPNVVAADLYRPSTVWWDGTTTRVLLEGHPDDLAREAAAAGLAPCGGPPPFPDGPHRGRISVAPSQLSTLATDLQAAGVRLAVEAGVGTVHVAADTEGALAEARAVATRAGGWLLREAGAPGLDGFGAALPSPGLQRRVKAAFDPEGRLSPGRIPW
jgi:FAD/FMN-containing dehydrogenase